MAIIFDEIVDRNTPEDIKHKKIDGIDDLIPMWVADMDFKSPPEVIVSLVEQAKRGVYGYPEADASYDNAVVDWFKRRHGWEVDPKTILKLPGVVLGVSLAVRALTNENDSVMIFEPLYGPIAKTIKGNKRNLVISDLVRRDSRYEIDFDDMENKIRENDVKMLILCNPHNPVGRVWTREELERIAEICLRHKVIVFADEIHNDFVYAPNKHTVYSTLSPEAADNSIVSMSVSKTFNLAGLQFSTNFIKNPELRSKYKEEYYKTGYDEPSLMGLTAAKAAYQNGKPWLLDLHRHLRENIEFVRTFLADKLPLVRLIEPEGTFLLWLDFSKLGTKLGLSDSEIDDIIVNKAKVWLDRGTMFGKEGEFYQRINVATPRPVLEEALKRIAGAFKEIKDV